MNNKIIYFLFGSSDLICKFTDMDNYYLDELIEDIEEGDYRFVLYKYDPDISSPAIILHEFMESRCNDYTTLTEAEFNKLSEI